MKTLILFLDALRFLDINQENTPFLSEVCQRGTFGPLKTLFGYHVEYSMISGCYPAKHNIWTWFHYDAKNSSFRWMGPFLPIFGIVDKTFFRRYLRKFISSVTCLSRYLRGKTRIIPVYEIPLNEAVKFDYTVDKNHTDFNSLPVPNLFDILRGSRVSFWASDWPFSTDNNGIRLSFFTNNEAVKLKAAANALIKKEAAYLHVWELDHIQHEFGIESPEAQKHLSFLDKQIKKIVADFGGLDNINLVIFSDHGMAKVIDKIDILPVLRPYFSKIDFLPDSTMVRIWLKDQSIKDDLRRDLTALRCGRIYGRENMGDLKINYNRSHAGDLLFALDIGLQLTPNFFQGFRLAKAMHGYVGHNSSLDGILIVSSPKIKPQKIESAVLVDVVPTILKLLNIDSNFNFDGKSHL